MDLAKFFATVRTRMQGLKQQQVDGFNDILPVIAGSPLAFAAYELATTWHETNATMQPVEEAYWIKNADAWRKAHLRYYPWHGRGYVQLTWQGNYKRADAEAAKAGLINPGDLLANPDLAMRHDIAALVLRKGMEQGWFTGVKLASVLPVSGVATRQEYMDARTIINGRDKSDLIEDYAQVFERALRDGGWA